MVQTSLTLAARSTAMSPQDFREAVIIMACISSIMTVQQSFVPLWRFKLLSPSSVINWKRGFIIAPIGIAFAVGMMILSLHFGIFIVGITFLSNLGLMKANSEDYRSAQIQIAKYKSKNSYIKGLSNSIESDPRLSDDAKKHALEMANAISTGDRSTVLAGKDPESAAFTNRLLDALEDSMNDIDEKPNH